jgi:hypothetical protein
VVRYAHLAAGSVLFLFDSHQFRRSLAKDNQARPAGKGRFRSHPRPFDARLWLRFAAACGVSLACCPYTPDFASPTATKLM